MSEYIFFKRKNLVHLVFMHKSDHLVLKSLSKIATVAAS